MSFSWREGKDEVHFITEEDLHEYSEQQEKEEEIQLEMGTSEDEKAGNPDAHEQYPGAVSDTGEINWDCPCLGGLGTEGPCVEQFRSAFSCWMFSDAEKSGGEKGDDCVDNFFGMSMCMQQNEEFYDELNARNKAEAAEAMQKYEDEENMKMSDAENTQKAIESEEKLAIASNPEETLAEEEEGASEEEKGTSEEPAAVIEENVTPAVEGSPVLEETLEPAAVEGSPVLEETLEPAAVEESPVLEETLEPAAQQSTTQPEPETAPSPQSPSYGYSEPEPVFIPSSSSVIVAATPEEKEEEDEEEESTDNAES